MGLANRAKQVKSKAASENTVQVDWKALEDYTIQVAQLEEPETMVGIVSGIIDVGEQEQEDAMIELKAGENEEEIAAKFKGTYFKTVEGKRYKCFKRPPAWHLVLTVDFPQIMLDKGKFCGKKEGEELRPLRLILNGEFVLKGGVKIASRPIQATNNKELGSWSLSPKNTLYKMAKDSKLIKTGDVFPNDRVTELLGKAFQFSVQVHRNKDGFYNEYCKYVGATAKGQQAPEIEESCLYVVSFDGDNTDEALKQLRVSIRNTMMRATDYEEAPIREQLETLYPKMKDDYLALAKLKKSEGKELNESHNPEFGEEEDDTPVFGVEEGLDSSGTGVTNIDYSGIDLPGDETNDDPF